MTRPHCCWLLAVTLVGAALYPALDRIAQRASVEDRLDRLPASSKAQMSAGELSGDEPGAGATLLSPDPALLTRVSELGPLLAGWQAIGGCGAGSGTGAGAGLKWIGRSVSGGMFNVQSQASYTRIYNNGKREHHTLINTLITREITEKWVAGASIPFVYKYFDDYFYADATDPASGVDLSNGGLGDVSVQLTRKLGRINATSLTALVGLPTGTYDAKYSGRLLQQQQLGFGKFTGTLILDHTIDQIWGVVVVGGLAGWRGGQNKLDNYRAPNATTYAYAGYFIGPFVPAAGLSVSAFKGHDRDQTLDQITPLFSMAANVSLEWSTDWIALLAGASLPYTYDGKDQGINATPRSPWGLGPWMVALGVALSPF